MMLPLIPFIFRSFSTVVPLRLAIEDKVSPLLTDTDTLLVCFRLRELLVLREERDEREYLLPDAFVPL